MCRCIKNIGTFLLIIRRLWTHTLVLLTTRWHVAKHISCSFRMPYVKFYELLKFGKYARSSAIEGFENSTADIMILHSSDDKTVPASCGYDIFYEKYQTNSRFHFILFEDRGHGKIYYTKDSNQYVRKQDTELMQQMLQFYLQSVN